MRSKQHIDHDMRLLSSAAGRCWETRNPTDQGGNVSRVGPAEPCALQGKLPGALASDWARRADGAANEAPRGSAGRFAPTERALDRDMAPPLDEVVSTADRIQVPAAASQTSAYQAPRPAPCRAMCPPLASRRRWSLTVFRFAPVSSTAVATYCLVSCSHPIFHPFPSNPGRRQSGAGGDGEVVAEPGYAAGTGCS